MMRAGSSFHLGWWRLDFLPIMLIDKPIWLLKEKSKFLQVFWRNHKLQKLYLFFVQISHKVQVFGEKSYRLSVYLGESWSWNSMILLVKNGLFSAIDRAMDTLQVSVKEVWTIFAEFLNLTVHWIQSGWHFYSVLSTNVRQTNGSHLMVVRPIVGFFGTNSYSTEESGICWYNWIFRIWKQNSFWLLSVLTK